MDPLTAMMVAGGVQALGGLISGRKERKAAKAAQKKNRQMEALMNVISIAGGQGVKGMTPLQPVASTTGGDALQALGQLGLGVTQAGIEAKHRKDLLELERAKIEASKARAAGRTTGLPDLSDVGSRSQLQSMTGLPTLRYSRPTDNVLVRRGSIHEQLRGAPSAFDASLMEGIGRTQVN